MIASAGATRVWLAAGRTDMRKSFNSLFALARDHLGEDPLSGHLFVFCNHRRDRLKVLYWDRGGLCILAKRLERGGFRWPGSAEGGGKVEVDWTELQTILGGLDPKDYKSRGWIRTKR
jgi:transposase